MWLERVTKHYSQIPSPTVFLLEQRSVAVSEGAINHHSKLSNDVLAITDRLPDHSYARLLIISEMDVCTMNCVIFSCAKTGRSFNSGLHADSDDLRLVPAQWKTWLLCRVCCRVHEFKFAGARVCKCRHNCRRNGDSQLCEFTC
jgi:hypothetical protein